MFLTKWFRSFQRRRAISQCIVWLQPKLHKLHGTAEHYSVSHVESAIRARNIVTYDICYAFAIYCSRDEFDECHKSAGHECNYWQLRAEVAQECFNGNAAFTQSDIAAYRAKYYSSYNGGYDGGDGGSDGGSGDTGGGQHSGGHHDGGHHGGGHHGGGFWGDFGGGHGGFGDGGGGGHGGH